MSWYDDIPVVGPLIEGGQDLESTAQDLSDLGSTFTKFFAVITNWRLWASLGWLLLGLALIIGAIVLYVSGTKLGQDAIKGGVMAAAV
jgi:hypothetical protein